MNMWSGGIALLLLCIPGVLVTQGSTAPIVTHPKQAELLARIARVEEQLTTSQQELRELRALAKELDLSTAQSNAWTAQTPSKASPEFDLILKGVALLALVVLLFRMKWEPATDEEACLED